MSRRLFGMFKSSHYNKQDYTRIMKVDKNLMVIQRDERKEPPYLGGNLVSDQASVDGGMVFSQP